METRKPIEARVHEYTNFGGFLSDAWP